MKLDKLIAQIISAPNFDHFSAVEVRAAYLSLHQDKTICPTESRRFCYVELVKLVKRGWLRKTVSKKKGITSFTKTELFDEKAISHNISLDEIKIGEKVATNINESLFDRLNLYKSELLISLGESEEYKHLSTQFPDLNPQLQAQYNTVRERNSKLLGKIKAIENLINSDEIKELK
ncbi:hypothetical protein WNY63_17750 [Pseudoalteromonas neustonica]|uniref:Response regulator n=1 Tax=Pseudoalteromonas neustonica TaxID=1840331 RepID=A0ABU9U698_9GAMM